VRGRGDRSLSKALVRAGEFWEPEYYDHLIRSKGEFHHYIGYIASNPKSAGLEQWKWVWVAPGLM
jgi:menaquinone-specific isochorismate synthase